LLLAISLHSHKNLNLVGIWGIHGNKT